MSSVLVGLGSPLLDITANVDVEFLEKFGLEKNGAVLIEQQNVDDTFMPMLEEVLNLDGVICSPGGSALNTIRVFQWAFEAFNGTGKTGRATFFGSVGNDREAEMLVEKTAETGVDVKLQRIEGTRTGKCISLINGTNRSLCASLGAAGKFTLGFLNLAENAALLGSAHCFYSAAHFFAVCPEAIAHLATKATELGRPFLFNLGAEYVPQRFKRELEETLPFVDVLFANEMEAFAFAKANGLNSNDLHGIALFLSQIKKAKQKHAGRIVLITRGEKPLIVARNGSTTAFPVVFVEKIVDTNGAGDAFCGGFSAAFVCGFPLEKCVQCALSAAAIVVQHRGCTFPKEWADKGLINKQQPPAAKIGN